MWYFAALHHSALLSHHFLLTSVRFTHMSNKICSNGHSFPSRDARDLLIHLPSPLPHVPTWRSYCDSTSHLHLQNLLIKSSFRISPPVFFFFSFTPWKSTFNRLPGFMPCSQTHKSSGLRPLVVSFFTVILQGSAHLFFFFLPAYDWSICLIFYF